MKLAESWSELRDQLLRMFPHQAPTGLLKIGNPGRDAPVLLTGNFTLTVRRLRRVLRGRDVWLLCANSQGINVWCAAAGGHLTHHDVIEVIRTCRINDHVDRRELILPQLAATGVERRKITERTGWTTRWGPARLEDLPGFLERGQRVQKRERFMRFPLWERLQMATIWLFPMLALAAIVLAALFSPRTALAGGVALSAYVLGLFVLLPVIKVVGKVRFVTFAVFAAAAFGSGALLLWLLDSASAGPLLGVAAETLVGAAVVAIDLTGTTPWYGSYVNTWQNPAKLELVEDRCTGSAQCVLVCPKDVLQMNGRRRKVELARPGQCMQCAACIVQCPTDALRFRYPDGRVVEATTIRRTKLNLLGRRTESVSD